MIVSAAGGRPQLAAQDAGVSPALYADLTWRCAGPFDGGPVASVRGAAGESGVYVITTPSGGVWKTIDGGDTWTATDNAGPEPLQADPHRWIDPANPRRIARTSATGMEVSLDSGTTWAAFHHLPISEVARLSPREHPVETAATPRRIADTPVNVSIADPARAGLVFAGTKTAVHVSFDDGAHWSPLRLNMPAVAINDLDIRGHSLVAATQGRSIWILDDISPLRQVTASSGSAPALLFKPVNATLPQPASTADAGAAGLYLDYYIGTATGDVGLDVLDMAGRVVHHAQSATPDANDSWLPVTRPLSSASGHHRVVWNLRFDPPPSPHHRFAQAARALFEDEPAEPDGPVVSAGTYRVRLTAGGRVYSQLLVVRSPPIASPAELRMRRQQFALAMRAYDAMRIAHRGFLQLARVRAEIRAVMTSTDPEIAAAAADLDSRLNVIDGSDWTGLVIPDLDEDTGEIEEEEEGVKHPEFVPPVPVSLSKDYDDPTSILGRRFENVTHAPAFAILGTTLGGVLTKVDRESAAPDTLALDTYASSCRQLAGVLKEWRRINAEDLPRLNIALAHRGLRRLPIATSVPAIACTAR